MRVEMRVDMRVGARVKKKPRLEASTFEITRLPRSFQTTGLSRIARGYYESSTSRAACV